MKILTVVLMLLAGVPASAQRHQPVIDMHLHASTADANGPPPLAICMSPSERPLSNPREPWGQVFIARLKNPPCSNPVWSPTTDQAVMDQTIAVLNRRNVIGVLSGPLERVEQWKKAAPGRFIAGFQFQIGREKITPDELRRLYHAGRFAVLAEVTNGTSVSVRATRSSNLTSPSPKNWIFRSAFTSASARPAHPTWDSTNTAQRCTAHLH